MTSTALLGYLLLFVAVGVGFILVHLLAGKVVRPNKPDAEKLTIYECGEPTIGSAWIQFDVRYYVVALLFVIFDVEVAFFFPWAVVYGKANAIVDAGLQSVSQQVGQAEFAVDDARGAREADANKIAAAEAELEQARARYSKAVKASRVDRLVKELVPPYPENEEGLAPFQDEDALASPAGRIAVNTVSRTAGQIAVIAFIDILIFFGVLLVGFAYLWKRGDIDWVRSMSSEEPAPPTAVAEEELVGQP